MTNHSLMIAAAPDTHADVCRTIDAICEKFPAKYWRELENAPLAERYPEAFVVALEQAGIFGSSVPEDCGGIGLPISALARIVEAIHASGCNADMASEQFALTVQLARRGGEAVRRDILPKIADGSARLQSLAIWEPGCGRDPDRIATTATVTPTGYMIEGKKRWVRFADHTNLMLVIARTGVGPRDLSLFLVDLDTSRNSIVIHPTEAMNNYCGAEVTLTGIAVSQDSLVGELNSGLDVIADLNTVRGILAAAAAGGCSRFFTRKGVTYANERVVFGNPIGKYQGIQFPLAQTYMESQGAALLLELSIALYETGQNCHDEARIAHHMAVQAAWDTADAAFTTHGGFAFAREYDIERKWREVRVMRNEAMSALQQVTNTALGTHAH